MGKKANAIVPASPDLLAPILAQFEAAPADEDPLFTTRDNMEGATPVVPQIKISKDGVFVFPGDQIVKQFNGVFMHKHRSRAWWENATITNSPPDCFSMDGHFCEANLPRCPIPEDARRENLVKYGTPWVCATCPKGQWGTGFKADGTPSRSKACKEQFRLFVLVTDPAIASAVPYKLMAPATSLKAVDEFLTMLTGKGIGYQTVLVTFGLRKANSADGFPYAELILTPHLDQKLSDRDREAFRALHKQFSGGFKEKAAMDFVDGDTTAPKAAEMPGSGAKTKSKFL